MALLNYLPAARQLASGLLLALSYVPTTKAANAADYFVSNLPGQPSEPAIKMHAGHIEVDTEHNGNLFFWHFQNQHMANRQRTVIWLNGGPGCSSEDGALMEIGPYRVRGDDLVYNNGSWNEYANLLFVDNPVGTGFSYVDTNSYLKELDNMADQFLSFMEQFFELFPEYEDDDIYFAGESYAGQHIPYIAKHILERNKEAGGKKQWNLQGLIIGNGWIAPKEQYGAYLKFAYDKGLLQKGSPEAKQLEQQWRICKASLATDLRIDKSECEKILQDFLETTASLTLKGKRQCYNMYDVRLKDDYPSCGMKWPPDLEDMTPYLRKKEVVSALHINDAKSTGWTECNGAVGSHFTAHDSEPSVDLLPEILKEVPITLFSGAEDLICNHFGTEDFISNMQWNGGKGFGISGGEQAPRRAWTFEGEEAGYWQEARNLTYVLFNEASHMVPFDWPRRSRDMLDRVMGVDYAAVGHEPADSQIGDEVPSSNSTAPAEEDKQKEIDDAKWDAYYRSGSVVLVIVIIGAVAFGIYVWRDRRRRRGYQGLAGGESSHRGGPGGAGVGARGLDRFREREGVGRDVEAGDFDESELDDLHVATPTEGMSKDPYAVGDDDDSDEDDVQKHKKNGGAAANGAQPFTG